MVLHCTYVPSLLSLKILVLHSLLLSQSPQTDCCYSHHPPSTRQRNHNLLGQYIQLDPWNIPWWCHSHLLICVTERGCWRVDIAGYTVYNIWSWYFTVCGTLHIIQTRAKDNQRWRQSQNPRPSPKRSTIWSWLWFMPFGRQNTAMKGRNGMEINCMWPALAKQGTSRQRQDWFQIL